MTQVAPDIDLQSRMRHLDELLERANAIADPELCNITSQVVQIMMEFHGAGLRRIVEHMASDEVGRSALDELSRDDVVSSLLLLYDLHPLDIPGRVRAALDHVRPYLGAHGGDVELLDISEDGVVKLRLQGSCHGCSSSAETVKSTIEQAIFDRAPEITAIQVENGQDPEPNHRADGFVPVEQLFKRNGKHLSGG